MKTITEILEWLNRMPEEFDAHFAAGEYGKAASDHEFTKRVADFIELDEEPKERLMARFDETKVKRAYEAVRYAE